MIATVLIADDDADIVRFLGVNLNLAGFDVHGVYSGDDALEVARLVRPDCVILDVMMPAVDGYGVARALRADPRTSDCAIIMLTARGSSADKVEGFTCGADDYIDKPFDPPELVARVKSTVRRRQEMRETSPLTGLPGNFAISRELEIRIEEEPQTFALVHADLDHFKAFNDHYGFVRGDQAIQFTVGVIRECIAAHNPKAFVGHIGGDDFVIISEVERVAALCRSIVHTFDAGVGRLYDEVDLVSGEIIVVDRSGETQGFPLLSISLGVALSGRHRFTSHIEAAAVATEMKNHAKRRAGSAYEIDRRTTIKEATGATTHGRPS